MRGSLPPLLTLTTLCVASSIQAALAPSPLWAREGGEALTKMRSAFQGVPSTGCWPRLRNIAASTPASKPPIA